MKPSNSPLVYQDYFHIEGLQCQFRVIRLWEQPKDLFLQSPGLLPFAVLSDTDNRSQVLNQVAEELDKIEDRRTRSNLSAATGVLAGLVLDDGLIRQILRRDVMRESVVYQEILQEGELIGEQRGEQRGILAGKQQVAINLLRQGMTVEQVVTVTELPRDVVEKLRDDNG